MTAYGYWASGLDGKDQSMQIIALEKAGCTKIFGERIAQGASEKRSELSKCLEELVEGDIFITSEMSSCGRSTVEMLAQINAMVQKGIFIRTLDGRLDTSLMPQEIVRATIGITGYCAEQELNNKLRMEERRDIAKIKGAKLGAKRKFDNYKVGEIMKKRSQGQGYGSIAKELGMKRSTVQKIVERERLIA